MVRLPWVEKTPVLEDVELLGVCSLLCITEVGQRSVIRRRMKPVCQCSQLG